MASETRFLWLAVFIFLGACAREDGVTVGELIGLKKINPEELDVLVLPPLTLPPGYEIRPTVQREDTDLAFSGGGAAGLSASRQARASLTGQGGVLPVFQDDKLFLEKAGAGQRIPDIRRQIDTESAAPLRLATRELLERLVLRDAPQQNETIALSLEFRPLRP